MQHVNPSETFPGTIVLVAPHMDDEVLACGGTLAQLPEKERIHIIYATDGMRSPAPILAWRDAITPDLGAIRRQEARTAAGLLGLPLENLHFCNLPEAELRRHREALSDRLMSLLGSLNPDTILLPFRYDRHPDHLAVNHVLTRAWRAGLIRSHLIEYFVYYRWRLLPERDVRRYIRPDLIMAVDLAPVAALKRAALECFASQTTRFYD